MSYVSVKIKTRYKNNELKEILKNMPMVQMRVGWAKTQKEDNGMRTAEVAYLNEVGHYVHTKDGQSYHVPARPFMRLSCEVNARHWATLWRTYFRQYLAGRVKSLADAAKMFCQGVIEDIRYMVEIERPFAPNSPAVAKRKKGRPPLVDTGVMMDKLTHEIHIAR